MTNRQKGMLFIIAGALFLILLITALAILTREDEPSPRAEDITEEDLIFEAEAHRRGEEMLLEAEKRNPLLKHLPFYSRDFEIHYGFAEPEGTDVFYIIVLHPMLKQGERGYDAEVEVLKEKAFGWIENKDVSPRDLDIEIKFR
jgi:hypothetical protein